MASPLWNLDFGQIGAGLKRLGDRGVDVQDWLRLLADDKTADRVTVGFKFTRDYSNVFEFVGTVTQKASVGDFRAQTFFVLNDKDNGLPRILLRSKSEDWPLGLANRSGAVGRNLMRQLNDVYTLPSVWNFEKTPSFTMKETGWNDFYVVNGVKYGTVQSWGKSPPGFMLMEDFLFRVRQTFPPWVSSALSFFRPMAVVLLDALFVRSGFVGTMMEDLPHWDNELASLPPGPDGRERIAVHYRISPYDRSRLRRFRRMVGRALFPFPFLRLKTADTWKFVGHACGTVRFGDDPATSVLNAVNRAHDVKNLYVVDASFFPSSGGINPALTIAANALRVADHILKDNPDFLPEA
jgi:choline dehydrogenase-like flavoprotein